MEENKNNKISQLPMNLYANGSLIAGILSLFMFFIPPYQFLVGGIGLLLAIASKKATEKFSKKAKLSIILSVISILFSIFLITQYTTMLSIMKDPRFTPYFHDFLNNIMKNPDKSTLINSYNTLFEQLQKVMGSSF